MFVVISLRMLVTAWRCHYYTLISSSTTALRYVTYSLPPVFYWLLIIIFLLIFCVFNFLYKRAATVVCLITFHWRNTDTLFLKKNCKSFELFLIMKLLFVKILLVINFLVVKSAATPLNDRLAMMLKEDKTEERTPTPLTGCQKLCNNITDNIRSWRACYLCTRGMCVI